LLSSKIFIRSSKTFFDLEERLAEMKIQLISKLQAMYKGYLGRKRYKRIRDAAIIITRSAQKYLFKVQAEKRRNAARVLRKFTIAFIKRNEPFNETNKVFLNMAGSRYLEKLAKQVPIQYFDKKPWPPCPKTFNKVF
jgi:myosin I